MITRKMIKNGYERGIITLELSPHKDGIVARIGEYWFYFNGAIPGEYESPERFKKDFLKSQILQDIYTTLMGMFHNEDFTDEYRYYEAILREAGCDK